MPKKTTTKKSTRVKKQPTPSREEPKGSQVTRMAPKPNLNGINFADEEEPQEAAPQPDPRANTEDLAPTPGYTPERNMANQQAARMAVERMQYERSVPKNPKPELPPISKEELERQTPQIYMVKTGATVSRGASSYTLNPGKLITNRDYDIESLVNQGVQLERQEHLEKKAL